MDMKKQEEENMNTEESRITRGQAYRSLKSMASFSSRKDKIKVGQSYRALLGETSLA